MKNNQATQIKKMSMVSADAAGIDIDGHFHFVAVPADRAEQPVSQFGNFTENLH